MKEMTRTIVFVAVAAAFAGAAAVAHFVTRPTPPAEFEKVGTEFYPEFTDPNEARSLKVVAVDEETLTAKEFAVEFKDGVWRIPSHHNYPADAEDRLADTAASVIGITRGALASRRERDQERFGVLAPLADTATSGLKGRGQRITLSRADGTTLADFIIGKAVPGRKGYYYIRRPNEKETYITSQEFKLSAKFTDWIDSDLLQLDRDRLTRIDITEPKIDEKTQQVIDDTSTLTRKDSTDDWKLAGLDETTSELNTERVAEVVSLLDDLKIVGIRPKPEGLTADLAVEVPAQARSNPALVNAIVRSLQADLRSLGFQVGYDEKNEPRIYSREGELVASTNQGVKYFLHFGDLFTGSQDEIEFGSGEEAAPAEDEAADKPDQAPAEDPDAADKPAAEEGAEVDSEANDGSSQPGRYVFVRVAFDESAIGEKPVPPEKPESPEKPAADKPAEEAPAEEKKPADGDSGEASATGPSPDVQFVSTEEADSPAAADKAADDAAADADPAADEEAPAKPAATAEEPPAPDLKGLQEAYEVQLADYQEKLRQYEEKAKQGREKVDELNQRFAEWYYVISADSFRNLRLKRSELIREKKEEAPADPGAGGPAAGALEGLGLPQTPRIPGPPSEAEAAAGGETPSAPKARTPVEAPVPTGTEDN
ncbi:MAG: DUF4340 domain-containing protein [Planctomycetaceae bacterium]|nr:DUF4340 domain-containing protein [Planctomycetaceae bacterium]